MKVVLFTTVAVQNCWKSLMRSRGEVGRKEGRITLFKQGSPFSYEAGIQRGPAHVQSKINLEIEELLRTVLLILRTTKNCYKIRKGQVREKKELRWEKADNQKKTRRNTVNHGRTERMFSLSWGVNLYRSRRSLINNSIICSCFFLIISSWNELWIYNIKDGKIFGIMLEFQRFSYKISRISNVFFYF